MDETARELKAAREREAATREILRVINRSPGDYQPVFDAILDNATRLCEAPLAFLMMREGDAFHYVAHRGSRPEFVEFVKANPVPLDSNDTVAARAARLGVAQQLADITDSDTYRERSNIHRVASADLEGIRTALFVPMMRRGEPIGIIGLYRREVRAFDEGHIALVSTFADQAVIAVDNVRLFHDLDQRNAALNEALERQTATSEILRAISRSPTDYQPVFETILDSATTLCGAPCAKLLLLRDDHLHVVASLGGRPEFDDFLRAHPLSVSGRPTGTTSRAVRERAAVQTLDLARHSDGLYQAGEEARVASVNLGGMRTLLAVPLLKGGEALEKKRGRGRNVSLTCSKTSTLLPRNISAPAPFLRRRGFGLAPLLVFGPRTSRVSTSPFREEPCP